MGSRSIAKFYAEISSHWRVFLWPLFECLSPHCGGCLCFPLMCVLFGGSGLGFALLLFDNAASGRSAIQIKFHRIELNESKMWLEQQNPSLGPMWVVKNHVCNGVNHITSGEHTALLILADFRRGERTCEASATLVQRLIGRVRRNSSWRRSASGGCSPRFQNWVTPYHEIH